MPTIDFRYRRYRDASVGTNSRCVQLGCEQGHLLFCPARADILCRVRSVEKIRPGGGEGGVGGVRLVGGEWWRGAWAGGLRRLELVFVLASVGVGPR